MNNKFLIQLVVCVGLITLSCRKEKAVSEEPETNSQASVALRTKGATQFSGIGYYAVSADNCNAPGGTTADYVVKMNGDLNGCLYAFIEKFECTPGGTYREEGTELFVGTYKGQEGTFRTAYKFEAKYAGCAPDGVTTLPEIFGRCQHPIIEGSGTGIFEGVSGRFDMKDNVEEGSFPYRGHLRY